MLRINKFILCKELVSAFSFKNVIVCLVQHSFFWFIHFWKHFLSSISLPLCSVVNRRKWIKCMLEYLRISRIFQLHFLSTLLVFCVKSIFILFEFFSRYRNTYRRKVFHYKEKGVDYKRIFFFFLKKEERKAKLKLFIFPCTCLFLYQSHFLLFFFLCLKVNSIRFFVFPFLVI